MNEQAIQDAYNLFKTYGYDKSQEEFLALISSNPNALQDAYKIFSSSGYNKSMDDFKTLMGVEVSFDEEDQKEAEKERAVDDAFSAFSMYGYDKEKDDFIGLISSNPKAFKDAYDIYSHSSGYNKPIEDFAVLMGISPDFEYTEVDELKKKDQSSGTDSSLEGYSSASATTLRDDPNAYEQAILSLSPEYIGLTEEEAAPLLSRKINDALGLDPNTNGFKFEETGIGDYIKVIAPNKQEVTISFDNQDGKDQLEELTILQDFIRLNKPSKAEVFSGEEESQEPIPAFVEEQISAISPETMEMTEEYVVPEMNYRFGPLGFRFEETGMMGDYMTVTAPNGEQIEISLDNFKDKSNTEESNKLKEFIQRNTKKISNLSAIESEYTNENKRFATEEDYNKAIEDVNLQSTQFRADMQSFLIENDILNKEREELKNITDPTQYKSTLDQIEQKQTALNDRKKSIDQRQSDLMMNAGMIEKAVGKYAMAKSLQGEWSGGIWDATMRGVGRIASGVVGAAIDIGYSSMLGGTSVEELDKNLEALSDKPAEVDEQKVREYNEQLKKIASGEQEPYITYSDGTVVKYTGEEAPSMVGAVGLAYRINKSIEDESKKIPMPTKGQTHGEWYNSLTNDQKQLLVDKSNDELKKDLKRNLLPAMRQGAEIVLGDDDTSVEWADLKKKGFWGGAVLGVAESLPAMVGSNTPIGWAQRTAAMYAQSADAVYEEMEQDPAMRDLSENEKAKVVVPIGLAVGALESLGFRNLIANKGLLNRVVLGAIGKSTSTTTAKTFGELVKNEIKSPLLKGGLTLLGAGLAEAETGSLQQIAEIGVKDIYNASQSKKLFQTPNTTAEYIKDVARAGAQEMIGGFMLGSVGSVAAAYSKGEFVGMDNKKFSVFESMAKDDNVEKAVVADLKNRINQGNMTLREGKEFLNNYRNSRALYAQIPNDISIESKKESMQLLSERTKLENQIKGKDQSLTARQRKRIGEINTQLEKLSENAVQEQTTDESMLRQEQPGLGLSQMASGNKIQILDDEEESVKNQIEQALSASSAPTITITALDGSKSEMSREDASAELDRINTKQFEFEDEVINELLDAASRPVDILTTALEASPTDAKTNITFMQEDGTETPVMGNEGMLAQLYQAAVRVNPLERTEQQQSIVNAVDTTSQLARSADENASFPIADVNVTEVVQLAQQHGVSEQSLYRQLSGEGRVERSVLAKIINGETAAPVVIRYSPQIVGDVSGRAKILFQASNRAKFDNESLTAIQKIAQRYNMNVNGFSPQQVDETSMSRELARFGLRAKRAKPSEFGSYGRGVYIVDESGRVFNPFKAKPLPKAAPETAATAPTTEATTAPTTEATTETTTESTTKPPSDSSTQLTLFQSTSATPDDSATDDELNNVATLASISAKNFRDLYRVNREIFGLNRIQSLAAAVIGDRMISAMAQRAGITKQQMYEKIRFDKTDEAVFMQGINVNMPLFESNQAAMQALADGSFIVHALTDPNVSSPLHELAHIFEHYLTEEERNKIIKAAKTQGWTTETSEYFARGFEKYLATGVSPIPQLTKVFAKFEQWLVDIYDGIADSEIDVKLNKEMKAIYDKMLQEDESIEKIPGYKRMIIEIQGIVMKSIERGRPKDEILKSALSYLQGSEVYQRANDVQREQLVRKVRAMFKQREKSAPSVAKILGKIKDIKRITMTEKAALAFQIRTLARGARDAMSANKKILREVSEKLSEMQKEGKITLAQMSAVINRFSQMNPFSDTSVESFVEYMSNVFENANHAQRMSVISKMLAIAKKVQYTKLGLATELSEPLSKMLALNPYIIPTEVLDAYEGILKMLSEKTKELSLQKQSKMTEIVNEVLDAVYEQNDKVAQLTSILDSYDGKVFNDEGNLSFAETLAKMIKDNIITEDDARLMKKFKSKIMRELFPAEPETEESKAEKKRKLEEEKSMVISIISRMTADVTNLATQEERALARNLLKMIKNRAALNGLDLKELYNLYNAIHNINNGFFSAYANSLLEKLDGTAEQSKLKRGIMGAKPLAISTFYSRLTTLFKKSPEKFFKLIERGPKYFIDQAFGNFKTKDIFDAVFRKMSSAISSFRLDYKNINDLLDKARTEVAKSYKNNPNSVLRSSFKMMTYMLQLEYESNEGNDEVNPAHEYLKTTIEKTRDGETKYSDKDADMLEDILTEYTDADTGEIDINKLYDSFNEAEKKAIKTIQEINTSLTPLALFVSSVIRGDKIRPITNYIHHSVLQSSTEDQSETASSIVSRYNNSMNPSTRAKTLLERTKGIKPLNFDVFSVTSKSSKYLLMDFHLTPAIRTVRTTLNGTKKSMKDDGSFSGKNRDIFNAIEKSFNETVSNVLIKEIEDTTVAEQAILEISKQGYRAVLASTGRFVAELTSNLMFAVYHPADFVKGLKMKGMLNSKKAVDIIRNLNSAQSNRIYPSSTLSGSMIDDNIMGQAVGIQGGTAKSDVANVIQTIYNNSLKKYKNSVEVVADTLISTPDKIVMRPVWFGTFSNYFNELTGMDPDLDKIADNDEAYMTEYADELEKATRMADERSLFVGASDNPFLGIGKNSIKANSSAVMKTFVMFNSYMTRFMIYEYTVARTGIYAAMGNGSISKAEGAKLLAAVTTRMTVYSLLMKLLSGGLIGLLFGVDDEEEKDDKSLIQMLGQSLTSTATSLLLGRDFGNAARTFINYGTEKMNEKFLDELREGEYNYYEDNIQYSPLIQGDELADYLSAMSGPFAPAINTLGLMVKKIKDKPKKEEEAKARSEKETKIRIPLEIFGNLGLVPLYKEIRKTVNDHIYKDLKKKMDEKQSDDQQKGFFDRMNRSDLKRYYPQEYNKRYGIGTPDYYKRQRENLQKKQERAIKDMQYNYIAPQKPEKPKRKTPYRPNYRNQSSSSSSSFYRQSD